MYVIGLRETVAPDSWSLTFMECYDAEDPQEIDLGMDIYCLVVDPGRPPTTAVSANASSTAGGSA